MQLWYKSIPLVLWNYKKKIIPCAPSFFRICGVEIRVNLYEVGVLKEKRNGGGRQVVWPCMKDKCSWTFLCVLSSADNNLRDKNMYLYCTLIKIRQEPIDWKYPMNPVYEPAILTCIILFRRCLWHTDLKLFSPFQQHFCF